MDSILGLLGLNKAATSPADFTAASVIGTQVTAVKSQINTTLNVISTAISGFNLLGVNNSILDTLKSLQTRTQDLLKKVASPADLQKEWAHINSELLSVQQSVAVSKYNKLLDSVKNSYTTVSNRVKEVSADKNISATLLSEYKLLQEDVSGSIGSVILTNPVTSGNPQPRLQDGVFTYYVPPSDITTPASASDRLYDLDTKYDQEQTGVFNWRRLYVKLYKYVMNSFIPISLLIIVIFSMLLSGVVCANYSYTIERWEILRVFYFIMGGLFGFWIVPFIGIFKTPYMYSYLIPMYPATSEQTAASTPTNVMSGGTTPLQPHSQMSLFTYESVGTTPTAVQTSNKNMLRMLCILDTILMYGFFTTYVNTNNILNLLRP